MIKVNAVILAAGEGTRMKSELPKVLHLICGRPMIAYALDLAASVGVKQPIIILGHGASAVQPILPKEAKVVIQAKPLGTGDAVLSAKRALSGAEHVLVLYADTPLLKRATVQRLVETHGKTGAVCTLLTAHLADPKGYGRIVRNELGAISGVVEETDATTAIRAIREVNVGPLVIRQEALLTALAQLKPSTSTKELYLTQIVSHLAKQEGVKIQAVRVEEFSESMGINSRAELARATGIIRQRIVEAHLNNGVTIEDPQTTFIDHGVSIGADTVVHPFTRIETGVVVGKRCTIGPFARLRSGVAIDDDTRVGNFVELVRTKVGRRVRMNHVTYLGDTTVDDEVNIGAGTITANYDGTAKHPTHIGKGAFIGCDTVLIAPVNVGPGAVTGAGSVVPKAHDGPAKSVGIGVPARALGTKAANGDGATPPLAGGRPAAPRASRAPHAGKSAGKSRVAAKRPAAKAKRKPAASRPKARATPKSRKPAAKKSRR